MHLIVNCAMVRSLLLLILLGLLGCTCDCDDPSNGEFEAGTLTDGFCISFGDSILLNHEDIEYYDFSTHIIYLKEPLSLFEDTSVPEPANMPFTVYAMEEPVYSGTLFPAWYSSIPNGPYIQWPSFYPAYVIEIGYVSMLYTTRPDTLSDPREDQRIVEALNRYGQYHDGLSVSVEEIEFDPTGKVSFSYRVTNDDSFNYYILSPGKMGNGLFHYFSNGLYLFNKETGWHTPQIEVITPEPWDSWDSGWLDLVSSQSSRNYKITYDQFDEVPPGQYDVFFRFPGLHHVEQNEIEQSQGRIWLGEISCSSDVSRQ